jgi:hypothetical protein
MLSIELERSRWYALDLSGLELLRRTRVVVDVSK